MAKDNNIVYFIDSNIFLRVLIKEDEKSFQECFRLLNLAQNKKITAYTSDLVLAEINWVLESFYKFNKSQVVSALEGIVNLKGLTIKSATNPLTAVDLYNQNNVKFVDAVIASDKIFRLNAVIISYDRDFDKLNVIRKEPIQISV